LRLVPHADFKKKEQLQETRTINSIDRSENSETDIKREDHLTDGSMIEKRSLAEKLEDKVEEIEKNNFEEFEISQRLEQLKYATKQLTTKEVEKENRSSESSNDKNGTGFFIAGLIFAILALIFFLRSTIVTETEDSVQGCFMTSMEIIGWMLLGAIFGVIALMFLIIGFTVFVASKEKQNNKSSVE
jgi:Fe2+ transport system protein B